MAEMKTVVVGDILIQDNQDRKFGADPQYAVLWATNLKGSTEDGLIKIPLILTKEELDIAIARAENNPEDIPDLDSEAPINDWDDEEDD